MKYKLLLVPTVLALLLLLSSIVLTSVYIVYIHKLRGLALRLDHVQNVCDSALNAALNGPSFPEKDIYEQ